MLKERILNYLKYCEVGHYYHFWDYLDTVSLNRSEDDIADSILDSLEGKYIKYCSEKEARPEVEDPNTANAEYFYVLKSMKNLPLENL